jgi:hypothetical protein
MLKDDYAWERLIYHDLQRQGKYLMDVSFEELDKKEQVRLTKLAFTLRLQLLKPVDNCQKPRKK